ncbi:acyl-CoA synthetase [Parvibium lacunae]|uniref:Acyl-CoA synthetase n=1 Tax=Parvibium lacunae TaxID=1888893 RepID=A0A368L1Y1_9BURK|nr:acyl-CoA synthetase [Parvibium lacunae]RCS57503.1 acyl-CoA synthetase [Parvibium lacunae]
MNTSLAENNWPLVQDKSYSQTGINITLLIPVELSFFSGHFPAAPILPGVVLVHWAAYFIAQEFKVEPIFSSLKQVKFLKKISPGTTVVLTLLQIQTGFAFSYVSHGDGTQDCKHASGQFIV